MTDIRGNQAATRTISAVTERKSGWKSKVRTVSKETSLEKKKLKRVATE